MARYCSPGTAPPPDRGYRAPWHYPTTLLARIADGLHARCTSVERMTLSDVVVFRAMR
jgi:hypothetical protein